VSPIARREVSAPVSQVRLMRWVGRAAVSRKASPTPRPSSARTALGVRFMSAPTRRNARVCSSTITACPFWRSAMAAERPPMPPPTIPISMANTVQQSRGKLALGQIVQHAGFDENDGDVGNQPDKGEEENDDENHGRVGLPLTKHQQIAEAHIAA